MKRKKAFPRIIWLLISFDCFTAQSWWTKTMLLRYLAPLKQTAETTAVYKPFYLVFGITWVQVWFAFDWMLNQENDDRYLNVPDKKISYSIACTLCKRSTVTCSNTTITNQTGSKPMTWSERRTIKRRKLMQKLPKKRSEKLLQLMSGVSLKKTQSSWEQS